MRYKDYNKNSFAPHFLCEWDIILYPYLFGQFIEISDALFYIRHRVFPVVFIFYRENTLKMLPFQFLQHSSPRQAPARARARRPMRSGQRTAMRQGEIRINNLLVRIDLLMVRL